MLHYELESVFNSQNDLLALIITFEFFNIHFEALELST
uniref:Uncharacterized protein n=1 Tax=Anguilla anguilla TaxID=7936 RepID=A0A0E9T3V1_ANGAN